MWVLNYNKELTDKAKYRIYHNHSHKKNKHSVIWLLYTIIQPQTMVIKAGNASITSVAMDHLLGSIKFTFSAKF